MDDFFQRFKGLILSSAYLVAGLMLLGYVALYKDRQADTRDIKLVTAKLDENNRDLAKLIETTKKNIEAAKKAETEQERQRRLGVRRMPVFLLRINEIARDNDVVIRTLTPVEGNVSTFEISFTATYEQFLKFTAELESLDTVVQNMSIRVFDNSQVPPVHAISYTIAPRNDAQKLANARTVELLVDVAAKDKRNPFQRFAYHAEEARTDPLIDLTWLHHLTGIGKVGEKRYATIDRLDYQVGSSFGGKTITEIFADRVYLEQTTSTGTRRFVMRFRKKLGDGPASTVGVN